MKKSYIVAKKDDMKQSDIVIKKGDTKQGYIKLRNVIRDKVI